MTAPKRPKGERKAHSHRPIKSVFEQWCECGAHRVYAGDWRGPWVLPPARARGKK